eukprot:6158179-Amphidinium_carterae.1
MDAVVQGCRSDKQKEASSVCHTEDLPAPHPIRQLGKKRLQTLPFPSSGSYADCSSCMAGTIFALHSARPPIHQTKK